jgi:hypothetical protein
MGGHHRATGHTLGPCWYSRAVGEAAHHVTFWTLLELIGKQMQTCLVFRAFLTFSPVRDGVGEFSFHGQHPGNLCMQ